MYVQGNVCMPPFIGMQNQSTHDKEKAIITHFPWPATTPHQLGLDQFDHIDQNAHAVAPSLDGEIHAFSTAP